MNKHNMPIQETPEQKPLSEAVSEEIFQSQINLLNFLFKGVVHLHELTKSEKLGMREQIRNFKVETRSILDRVEGEMNRIIELKKKDRGES